MMYRTLVAAAAVVVFIATARPLDAQSPDVRELQKQIASLVANQAAMQQQLDELTAAIRGRAAAAPAVPADLALSIAGAPARGAATARVTLIEFSDYQCPFCGQYVRDTYGQLERDYVRTGKVRYVFRNLPLEALHPQAFKAHEAALCAGDQGKYWEMHDQRFADQRALDAASLGGHARTAGLDATTFQACFSGGAHAARIRADLSEATRIGARGTPTFFIGLTTPGDSKVKVVRILRGAQPYAAFREAIDSVLAATN
jgi:protein-disulfide isomerase